MRDKAELPLQSVDAGAGLRRRTVASCLALIIVAPAMTQSAEPTATPSVDGATFRALLDGLVFLVEYGPKGEPSLGQDVLSFADGLFASRGCNSMGFAPAPYWLRVDDTSIQFKAEMVSAEHGELAFIGRITGDEIDVTSLWTRQRWYRTVLLESWYQGRIADPDEPLPTKS